MMSRILFLANHDVVIYNFRRELIERLLSEGYEVIISSPYGERIKFLKSLGCKYVEAKIKRHGKNPLDEVNLLMYYKELVSVIKPNMIFTYTIKPNLYGAITAAAFKIPIVVNITGLGGAVKEHNGCTQKLIILAYRFALRKAQTVFVQNEENRQFFIKHHIAVDKLKLLPGSGVNLLQWVPLSYPNEKDGIKFLFIGRLMRDKGVRELIQATKILKREGKNISVDIVGFCEEEYKHSLVRVNASKYVQICGQQLDIVPYMKKAHAVILPSYHEGMANVLLEAAASARPVIATNVSGCKETYIDGVTGIGFEAKSVESLVDAMRRFIDMPFEEKRQMGMMGRRKMEKEFNRQIVVEKYMNELKKNEE